ncbi:MAG: hypothetical protein H6657_15200 [Ardenticatenaceae bacterium]|nr:hypothetical protein [Ardenticatenaceae bacterium]
MNNGTPHTLADQEQAIWRTLAYVDLFDYPLTAVEIHRYLEGVPASLDDVCQALAHSPLLAGQLICHNGFYCLPGRETIFAIRQQRQQKAQQLWTAARRYGTLIAQLPFVRLVAVTGSLAMSNVADEADIDYFIVTENGRLWLARALVIGVVRLAARRGIVLCPNYFVAESALTLPEHTIYTAREIAQMVPLCGVPVYQQLRAQNSWVTCFLPNADGPPHGSPAASQSAPLVQKIAERLLRTSIGDWLEQWEQARKIEKLSQTQKRSGESCFTAVICKGHSQAHQQRTLSAYQTRLTMLSNHERNP